MGDRGIEREGQGGRKGMKDIGKERARSIERGGEKVGESEGER